MAPAALNRSRGPISNFCCCCCQQNNKKYKDATSIEVEESRQVNGNGRNHTAIALDLSDLRPPGNCDSSRPTTRALPQIVVNSSGDSLPPTIPICQEIGSQQQPNGYGSIEQQDVPVPLSSSRDIYETARTSRVLDVIAKYKSMDDVVAEIRQEAGLEDTPRPLEEQEDLPEVLPLLENEKEKAVSELKIESLAESQRLLEAPPNSPPLIEYHTISDTPTAAPIPLGINKDGTLMVANESTAVVVAADRLSLKRRSFRSIIAAVPQTVYNFVAVIYVWFASALFALLDHIF